MDSQSSKKRKSSGFSDVSTKENPAKLARHSSYSSSTSSSTATSKKRTLGRSFTAGPWKPTTSLEAPSIRQSPAEIVRAITGQQRKPAKTQDESGTLVSNRESQPQLPANATASLPPTVNMLISTQNADKVRLATPTDALDRAAKDGVTSFRGLFSSSSSQPANADNGTSNAFSKPPLPCAASSRPTATLAPTRSFVSLARTSSAAARTTSTSTSARPSGFRNSYDQLSNPFSVPLPPVSTSSRDPFALLDSLSNSGVNEGNDEEEDFVVIEPKSTRTTTTASNDSGSMRIGGLAGTSENHTVPSKQRSNGRAFSFSKEYADSRKEKTEVSR